MKNIADRVKLSKEEIQTLQNGESIVVEYDSPVDLMIGQWDRVKLLIEPEK